MTLKREGDLLAVFDDFGLADKKPTGKLLWYESDQLVEVSDLKKAGGEWSKYEQESGVLFDKWGREVGFAVTAEHGQTSVPKAKATIYPVSRARLLRHVWRCNQKRGTAPILTGAADLQDLYELQSKELQTAKVQSSMAGVIKKAAAADDQDYTRTAGTDPGPTYKTLEAFLGGGMEYLEPDDSFEMLNYNRPEVDFVAAINQLGDKAVTPLGITKTYARLATDSSYTAFRGDMLITWAQFYCDQKMLERYLCDWTAEKALAWKYGTLPADMTASWDWPRMPAVDPLQEAQAIALELKTAQTNYADKFGPEWVAKAEQLAREIIHLKGLGLPTVFEGEKDGLRFDGQSSPRSPNSEGTNGNR
jgi:capsid protein